MKKIGFAGLNLLVNAVAVSICVALIMIANNSFSITDFLQWGFFFFFQTMLISNLVFARKFVSGKGEEVLPFIVISILITECLSFLIFAFVHCSFKFDKLDWVGALKEVIHMNSTYYAIGAFVLILFLLFYTLFLDRRMLSFFTNGGMRGKGKLKKIEANLENSRWMTNEERNKAFAFTKFSALDKVKKDGVPLFAKAISKNKDMEVVISSPAHSLIIGATGSGKTTTFVNPMIQILGASSAGSSMIITDPKGELFSLHSAFLTERGYEVKVIDLRDTYSSYRWNPLEHIWDAYRLQSDAENNVFKHTDDVSGYGLKLNGELNMFKKNADWWEFNGEAFFDYNYLIQTIKIFKKKIYDEVYEDINDLITILVPIENKNDQTWEKGARTIIMAVLLAMLEDSDDPSLGMCKEKFNFFNMTKILQNSSEDYKILRNYFACRSPLSKAFSLSKQVCDSAEQTRASYMSIVYEKLTMFNDAGLCALTSSSDFLPKSLSEKPTALFFKIPDEKDTRHNLASVFILDIYKSLIKVANDTPELTLPRNVYFIMDEFGNMPKIEKFDKMITVGRSRKIWFNMIIQSYAQLNNVYGDKVADIIKGNCGIKMFIGSNDIGTCKEFSELCGNVTVVTKSTSIQGSGSASASTTNQMQTRPLIYPSDLQRLNHPGDIGHSVIVTFGNYPLNSFFTPSYKFPLYKTGKMDTKGLESRFFDESAVLYDISERFSFNGANESNGQLTMDTSQTAVDVSGAAEIQQNDAEKDNVSLTNDKTDTEAKAITVFENAIKQLKELFPDATSDSLTQMLIKNIEKGE